jgi:FkbM family methyltransferase
MPSVVKTIVSNLLERSGYTVIPKWRLGHYPVAVLSRKLLQLLDIDCVLDVGANLGQYHDFLRIHVGYSGAIVSFEPIASHVEALRDRARHEKNWVIQGYALGSTAGQAELNVTSNTQFSSFLEPNHAAAAATFIRQMEVSERVQVEIKTLDEVLPELERVLGLHSFYLKLDTQGFDLEVAKGAVNCLSRMKALQTEASVKPIYAGIPDHVTAVRAFQAQGFEVSGIFPTNPDLFPLMIDFDCLMINRRYLPEPETCQPSGR